LVFAATPTIRTNLHIMIDHCPFTVTDIQTIESFIHSRFLKEIDEKVAYDETTGEQYTKSIYYKFYNLNFVLHFKSKGVYSKLTCKGSFHYLMNEGKHNANNINFISLQRFLFQFQTAFNIDLKKLVLGPPEIGINIYIPYDVKSVIDHVICETRKEFHYNPPGVKTSKISGKSSSENRLKVYSKSHDCPKYCDDNLLRAEKKNRKMRAMHNMGIRTMYDLLDREKWRLLSKNHMEAMDRIVIFDFTIKPPSNERIKKKLSKYSNQRYWSDLIENCSKKTLSADTYNRKIKDLNSLSKKYGSDIRVKILDLAYSHWDWFFTDSKNTMDAPIFYTMDAPFIECGRNTTIIRICPITGVDISMQKEESNLLSNTGLKHLKENEPPLFNKLVEVFITGKDNKFERDIYSRLSKQIRNRFYNQRDLFVTNQKKLFLN